MKTSLRWLLPLTVLLLGGCAVSTDNSIMTSPAARSGGATETSRQDERLPGTVAILPFTNQTESDFAFEVVRRTMANHFATKNYRWLHWRDVDSRLALAGLDDPQKLAAMSPAEIANALGVDGLIYGNITHYNKTFAGIYAQIAVGVELRFVDSDSNLLWEVKDVRRSHAGGVSTSPVGLLLNALVSAKHLYGDINLYRAADDLGRELAGQIPEPASLARKQRPVIRDLVHSGVGKYLRYGDTLEIGMEGDPGMSAAAVIDGIGVIDLDEVSPGEYMGRVNLPRTVNLEDVVVTGRLQDDNAQTTSWISPYGLLTVDNTPPSAVQSLVAESRDGAIALSWRSGGEADIASYQVTRSATETGMPVQPIEAADSRILLDEMQNFEPVYLSVVAIDRAGNTSIPTRISGIAAPDPRFGSAASLPSLIPPVISGTFRMTPAANPYYLRSPARLATDGVLLIAPGVEVIVSPSARLTVQGELHTFGGASSPVSVAGDAGQGYREFLVLQSTAPVNISGLYVDGAGIPVQIMAGAPLITDSSFINSQFNAVTVSGTARPTIRNSLIARAKASGVIVEGQAQPTFAANRFLGNDPFHIQNGSTYQINVKDNTFDPVASPMTLLGDILY